MNFYTIIGFHCKNWISPVKKRTLWYDLLIRMNSIKEMGWVQITPSCAVEFCSAESVVCATRTIDESDFSAEFDHGAIVWTITRKRTGGQAPTVLRKAMAEYPGSNLVPREYEPELKIWLDNCCMMVDPDKKLRSAKCLIPPMSVVLENKGRFAQLWTTWSWINTSTSSPQMLTFLYTN